MEMGIPGIQLIVGYRTVPGLSCRFPGNEGIPGLGRIPVMKLMSRDLLPSPAKEGIFFCMQGYVSKSGKLSVVKTVSVQIPYHREAPNSFRQIHEPAAFRHAGKSIFQCLPHGAAHGYILAERFCIQLRISASQIESLNILRQFLIQKRAELYDLPSHFPKSFQIVFIIKAKGLISGHRQPYFFLPGKYDRCIFQIWRFPAQR